MSVLKKIVTMKQEVNNLVQRHNQLCNTNQAAKAELTQKYRDGQAGRGGIWGSKEEKKIAKRLAEKKKLECDKFVRDNQEKIDSEIISLFKQDVIEFEKVFASAYEQGLALKDKLDKQAYLTKPFYGVVNKPASTGMPLPFKQESDQSISDLYKIKKFARIYKK